jgi:hypothetical protein
MTIPDVTRAQKGQKGGQAVQVSLRKKEKGQPSSNTVGDLIVVHRLAYSVVGMWQAEASRRPNRR